MENNHNLKELRKKFRKVYRNSKINATGYNSNLYMQPVKPSAEKRNLKIQNSYTPDWMVQK